MTNFSGDGGVLYNYPERRECPYNMEFSAWNRRMFENWLKSILFCCFYFIVWFYGLILGVHKKVNDLGLILCFIPRKGMYVEHTMTLRLLNKFYSKNNSLKKSFLTFLALFVPNLWPCYFVSSLEMLLRSDRKSANVFVFRISDVSSRTNIFSRDPNILDKFDELG